jgi:hypothetical protein
MTDDKGAGEGPYRIDIPDEYVEQIRDAIHKLKKNSLQFDYVNFNKSKRSTEFLRIVGVQKWGKGGEG